jgi:hypothetical protein
MIRGIPELNQHLLEGYKNVIGFLVIPKFPLSELKEEDSLCSAYASKIKVWNPHLKNT